MNYHNTPRKERIRGVKTWTNEKNEIRIMFLNFRADPDKDPDRDGLEWYEKERKSVPKAKWLKEYEGEFEVSSSRMIFGKDYCDYDGDIHLVDSFDIKGEFLFSLDFGQSNPTAGLVGCFTREGKLFIIDEYYKPAIPSVSSKEMFVKFSYLFGISEEMAGLMSIDERLDILDRFFQIKIIDPTTRAKNRTSKKEGEEIPYSVLEDFFDNGWDFELGNNDVDAGITKIREMFQVDKNKQSRLYIFRDKCPNLIKEIGRYKYKEQSDSQARGSNAPETPVKKEDHAVDSLRYMVMSRPFLPKEGAQELTVIQKDIRRLLKPTGFSAAWDIDG